MLHALISRFLSHFFLKFLLQLLLIIQHPQTFLVGSGQDILHRNLVLENQQSGDITGGDKVRTSINELRQTLQVRAGRELFGTRVLFRRKHQIAPVSGSGMERGHIPSAFR